MDPFNPGVPRSWWAWMFSPIRMASSTTIPSTTMKANSEIMLIDTSSDGISQNVPRNEIGMPRLTQKAKRKRRNNASTMNTRQNPVTPFRIIKSRRPARYTESSCHVVRWIPSGKRWAESLMCRCTISEISIAFSSPTRKTFTNAQRSPLKYDSRSFSSNPSMTVVTWPSRSRVPSGRVRRTICSKSSTSFAWPFVRSNTSPPSFTLIDPPGRSTDDLRIAIANSSKVMLYWRSVSSETSIESSISRTFASSTCVMPSNAISWSRISEA